MMDTIMTDNFKKVNLKKRKREWEYFTRCPPGFEQLFGYKK